MSLVWTFFVRVPNDASKAKCTLCGVLRSLGSTERAKQSTSNCAEHVTLKHAKEWKEAQEAAKPKKESEKKQQVDDINFLGPLT